MYQIKLISNCNLLHVANALNTQKSLVHTYLDSVTLQELTILLIILRKQQCVFKVIKPTGEEVYSSNSKFKDLLYS